MGRRVPRVQTSREPGGAPVKAARPVGQPRLRGNARAASRAWSYGTPCSSGGSRHTVYPPIRPYERSFTTGASAGGTRWLPRSASPPTSVKPSSSTLTVFWYVDVGPAEERERVNHGLAAAELGGAQVNIGAGHDRYRSSAASELERDTAAGAAHDCREPSLQPGRAGTSLPGQEARPGQVLHELVQLADGRGAVGLLDPVLQLIRCQAARRRVLVQLFRGMQAVLVRRPQPR